MNLLFAQNEDPTAGRNMTDLERHDAKYHPNGYKDGDHCKYRQALARGDDADRLAVAEREEGEALDAVQKIIDRFNALGVLMMTAPLDEAPYEKMLGEYGIKPGDKEYGPARDAITAAQEWYDNEGMDEDDPADTATLRGKVLDLNDAIITAKKGGKSTSPSTQTSAASQAKGGGGNPPKSKTMASASDPDRDQAINELYAFRDVLERVARLLNGRTGNIQALSASSRWGTLQKVAADPGMAKTLAKLASSDDQDIAKAASSLKKVHDNIVKSSKNNWNDPAGKVIQESDLPE